MNVDILSEAFWRMRMIQVWICLLSSLDTDLRGHFVQDRPWLLYMMLKKALHPFISGYERCETALLKDYHGTSTGLSLFLSLPITTSQLPMSRVPRGAQYVPVLSIEKSFSTQSARICAASSGFSAPPSFQNLSKPILCVISVRMKLMNVSTIYMTSYHTTYLGWTMPTAIPFGFRSNDNCLPTIFDAALEP